jgi:hypothetical protein
MKKHRLHNLPLFQGGFFVSCAPNSLSSILSIKPSIFIVLNPNPLHWAPLGQMIWTIFSCLFFCWAGGGLFAVEWTGDIESGGGQGSSLDDGPMMRGEEDQQNLGKF